MSIREASIRNTIKSAISWLVVGANVAYGLWMLFMLLGAAFVMGSNDTALEIVGIFAFCLSPIPAAVFALRHRRLAALCFAISASLWIIGDIDNQRYLAQHFGPQGDHLALFRFWLKTAGVQVALGLFYGITDLLHWPTILRRLDPGMLPMANTKS